MTRNSNLNKLMAASTLSAVAAILAMPEKSLAVIQTQSFSDSFAVTITNFTDQPLTVSRFDPSLGTLESIAFKLDGTVQGNVGAENLDASPTTVELDLQAELTVNASGLPFDLVQTIPVATETRSLAAYDNVTDLAGTSGFSVTDISSTSSTTNTIPSTDAFFGFYSSTFTGTAGNPGDITLLLDGIAQSTGSGSGNLVQQFNTNAGADFTITYTYDDGTATASVPFEFSPALGLFFVGGLFGGSSYLKRKKAAKIDLK